MTNAKLEKWAQLLLDMGKSNNLINFRDRKSSSVEFVSPDAEFLFGKLNGDTRLEVYDPKLDGDRFDDVLDGEKTKPNKEGIDRGDYIAKYGARLKRNQILPYNLDGSPIQAIKNISKKAKTAIEETGVNIAYVAFGFIHWTEREDSEIKYRAPVLLIPVAIKNDSSVTPFFISSSGDEVTVNPTFSYKLSSEFNVQLPEYEGQSLAEYLSAVEELVKKLNWTVSSEVKLGIFSFLKINMYRDLKDNADKVLKNPNVRGLMGEEAEDGEEALPPVTLPSADFHNVVDADSSQLEAVRLAKSGRSFVLQGPPGTGKSQTITNIIAECLMDGKKVLFVSEKLAALEVVYEKLKRAGLGEFCLRLHSYKANKKDVIAELERTLKLAKSGVSTKAENELAALEKARRQLDDYERELHLVRDTINLSLYGLYEKYSAYRKYNDVDYIISDLGRKGELYLDGAIERLDQYVQLTSSIGQDYKLNPWYGYLEPDSSYAAELNTKAQFGAMVGVAEKLQREADGINDAYRILADSRERLEKTARLLRVLGNSQFILPGLLSVKSTESLLSAAEEMQRLSAEIKTGKEKLEAKFDKDVYQFDGNLTYKKLTKQFNGALKRLFSKEYKALANDFRLCAKDGKKLKYGALCDFAQTLCALQAAQAAFASAEAENREKLNEAYDGLNTCWPAVIAELKELLDCLKEVGDVGGLSSFGEEDFLRERKRFTERSKAVFALLEENGGLMDGVSKVFDAEIFNLTANSFAEIIQKLNGCLQAMDTRNNWIVFYKLLNEMQVTGIREFVDLCLGQKIAAELYPALYRKNFYKQWIDRVVHGSAVLTEFNRVSQDRAVATFAQKDKLKFEINKAKIKQILSSVRPDLNFIAGGSPVSVLLREAQKKRKQKPVRQLLGEIADLAQLLKPCFMMSPLSVSTFLDSDRISFDTVVFDEASQIFPQDAVGAIYRGKQVIVVGDSKQMPPSNFFNAMTGSDEYDEDDEDIADFESILDLCATTMPQLRLKWHYRSRFEELISFSNRNFYEGDLISFPSAKTKKAGLGVDYYHVDGVFDRQTKTNRAEAEFITELVFRHFEEYPERSLGVVAFSAAQQDLIEKCLSKRRREDPSKEEFFKADREEPFFIKNLETVQGDERDTIIFSMAYARDAQGRFLANFGPVNRAGGERRLNVAVTRAKYNVQFVASVHSHDIDLKGSQSVGARLLREYLDFAENGMIALERTLTVNPFEQFDSDFETDVYDFLTEQGFSLDTQVGCSKFRIDLALKEPDTSDYRLAIECDGATYHSSSTARDRDRLRQQILENMGWKFYRIWSTDWFRNNKVEKERLLAAATEAMKKEPSEKAPAKAEGNPAEDKVNFIEEKPALKLRFPYYTVISVEEVSKRSKGFFAMLRTILNAEAPLSEEWFLKRAVRLFGREKVTSAVVSAYERQMLSCRSYGIIRRNGFLYLEGLGVPMLRVYDGRSAQQREVKHICLEELSNGMHEIIKHNVTVSKDGLFKEVVTQLGFSRMGEAITARLNEALQFIGREINIEGDVISLK